MQTRGKATILALGCAAALVLPASGDHPPWDCHWDHPCAEDPGGTLDCWPGGVCWCDADWDTSPNWWGVSCGGVPDASDEPAIIIHSNSDIGFCDGGCKNGQSCMTDANCYCKPNSYPCALEDALVIQLDTLNVGTLDVETKDTVATNDALTLRFESVDAGGNILTTDHATFESSAGPLTVTVVDFAQFKPASLKLDATNGKVTLGASNGGKVKTGTGQ